MYSRDTGRGNSREGGGEECLISRTSEAQGAADVATRLHAEEVLVRVVKVRPPPPSLGTNRTHSSPPPGTNRTHISPPPGTNRTHISPPPGTKRTHISPPPRSNRTRVSPQPPRPPYRSHHASSAPRCGALRGRDVPEALKQKTKHRADAAGRRRPCPRPTRGASSRSSSRLRAPRPAPRAPNVAPQARPQPRRRGASGLACGWSRCRGWSRDCDWSRYAGREAALPALALRRGRLARLARAAPPHAVRARPAARPASEAGPFYGWSRDLARAGPSRRPLSMSASSPRSTRSPCRHAPVLTWQFAVT